MQACNKNMQISQIALGLNPHFSGAEYQWCYN